MARDAYLNALYVPLATGVLANIQWPVLGGVHLPVAGTKGVES